MSPGRRSITVPRELVVEFFTTGNAPGAFRIDEGLPPNAGLSGAGIDARGDLVLWFKHDDWSGAETPLRVRVSKELRDSDGAST